MALLHRFSKLNDRSNTGIFTFIVTRSVTRDLHRDATTKDFYYGYHRWAISFTRANDKVLGVYLILRDPSPSATTFTDFSITLLNREHFSRNEQYSEKQCKFTSDHPAHGINKWIPLSDIQTRNFGDETGEFLLELSLSNLMTVFETNISLQASGSASGTTNAANNSNQQTSSNLNSNNPANSSATVTFKNGKLETSYFHFATFEWNISIVMHNVGGGGPASMVRGLFKDNNNEQDLFRNNGTKSNRTYLIFLNRLTGFENSCRIQYRIVLGQDQIREDSGMIEQISDMNGRSRGYQIDQHTFAQLTAMGMANLYFEFYSCNPISEAKVSITRSISPTINCYDRNKQGWSIESDMEGENLKLKLYFMDMHSVPRNHLRYVSWFTYVIIQDPHSGAQENIMVKNSPHYNYYIQDGIDMGVVMETDILVADIKSSTKKYLENESNLTVHVEWYDSIMLFNHIYHKYDDIARMHCHQMRREIAALTSENYSLERQIFAYQRSISMANNQITAVNNMARLSISSPSKPNSQTTVNTGSGFATSSPSHSTYRSSQLESSTTYYNTDDLTATLSSAVTADSYYDHSAASIGTRPSIPDTISYATPERSATPVPSSPMQPHGQTLAQSQHHQLTSYLDTGSGPPSSRQSFSGPATPHHHGGGYHHTMTPSQQSSYTPQSTYHHHQLPTIPISNSSAGAIPYSTSGYRLSHSPHGSNTNLAQMYRDDGSSLLTTTGRENLDVNDGSVDDAYQTYSGRYKLTV